jgi:predicted nucleotidyltransferase
MIATDDTELRRALEFIVERVDPRRVILFGSRARGDARHDSDYDLLIVEDDSPQLRATRGARLGQLYVDLVGTDVPEVDLLLHGAADYEHLRTGRNNVVARAEREGLVVYERPQR